MADDELTYADAGVNIEASESATDALIEATGDEIDGFAGLLDIGDRYLALSTDGVGTKILVAEALDDYSTIGIDCIAMNVNDMVASGVEPIAFVDYLATESPDESIATDIGTGLATGAESAGIALLGGETAVMPEVISGLDLAGACLGMAKKAAIFPGDVEPGDILVGWPSSGVHSNGLTLAREAVTRSYAYTDMIPELDKSIGRTLLEPTRIYTDLLDPLREAETRAAAHITGGGWTNLGRLGECKYVIEDPCPTQPIFEVIQAAGQISGSEMYRTFNMGTGFVAAVPAHSADSLIETSDGRRIGRVEPGSGVKINGYSLSLD